MTVIRCHGGTLHARCTSVQTWERGLSICLSECSRNVTAVSGSQLVVLLPSSPD